MQVNKISIGIDVGQKGGYAILHDGVPFCVKPYSQDEFVFDLSEYGIHEEPVIACVEKVGAMPGQGVTSMFNFGKVAGFIEGVLTAYGIPYQLIPPQTWKKEFSLNSDKQNSIMVARRLFPSVNLRRTDKCKKDHDGMAEALLMAEYARRKM